MIHFALLSHADTFAVVARLHRHVNDFDADGLLRLRSRERELPSFTEWKSLQRLLEKLGLDDPEATVSMERLLPGRVTKWAAADDGAVHIAIPMVTNPGAQEYVRNEMVHMPAGSVWRVDRRVLGCSANWGQTARIHLRVACPPKAKSDVAEE